MLRSETHERHHGRRVHPRPHSQQLPEVRPRGTEEPVPESAGRVSRRGRRRGCASNTPRVCARAQGRGRARFLHAPTKGSRCRFRRTTERWGAAIVALDAAAPARQGRPTAGRPFWRACAVRSRLVPGSNVTSRETPPPFDLPRERRVRGRRCCRQTVLRFGPGIRDARRRNGGTIRRGVHSSGIPPTRRCEQRRRAQRWPLRAPRQTRSTYWRREPRRP